MTGRRVLQTWTAVVLSVVATLSRAENPPAAQSPPVEKMELQKKQLGAIRPVHALGDVYLAGQPSPEDLRLLKEQGIKTIITLRKSKDRDWDEAAAVKQHGMTFVEAPFQGADELKPEVFDQVRKVLCDKKRGPTVLHCGSANRVGAVWYAHRVLDAKLSPEAAMKEAKVVGLRTQAYLEKAQAYVLDEQSKSAKP